MRKVTTYLLAGSIAIAGGAGIARGVAYAQDRAMARQRHPMIHAAIASLVDARKELVAAAHDFGGHKAAAISAVDAALKQLRLADAYAK